MDTTKRLARLEQDMTQRRQSQPPVRVDYDVAIGVVDTATALLSRPAAQLDQDEQATRRRVLAWPVLRYANASTLGAPHDLSEWTLTQLREYRTKLANLINLARGVR